MKARHLVLSALLIAAGTGAGGTDTVAVKVKTVIAGDRFTVETSANLEQDVQLAGIDAPDKEQPFSKQAMRILSDKIIGKKLRLKNAREVRRNFLVADAFLGDRWLNIEMVEEGCAWYDNRKATNGELAAAQVKAQAARRGLWKAPHPVPPWEFRKHGRQKAKRAETGGDDANKDIVYITETSNKYHRANCRRLRHGKRAVTRQKAEKWSYKPCPICKP